MAIFRTDEQKKAAKEAEQLEIKRLLDGINEKLEKNTDQENKEDLTTIVNSLVGFFAQENPLMFKKGATEAFVTKEFFKTLGGIAIDHANPFKAKEYEGKVKKFMKMLDVIKKYGNVE